jgi:3-oxoacyl-[acyl-carrier protein] reductase
VNSLAPGRIQTARGDRLLEATAAAQGTSPDAMLSELVKTIPSGRLGTIDDIADAVCFLVSGTSHLRQWRRLGGRRKQVGRDLRATPSDA